MVYNFLKINIKNLKDPKVAAEYVKDAKEERHSELKRRRESAQFEQEEKVRTLKQIRTIEQLNNTI